LRQSVRVIFEIATYILAEILYFPDCHHQNLFASKLHFEKRFGNKIGNLVKKFSQFCWNTQHLIPSKAENWFDQT